MSEQSTEQRLHYALAEMVGMFGDYAKGYTDMAAVVCERAREALALPVTEPRPEPVRVSYDPNPHPPTFPMTHPFRDERDEEGKDFPLVEEYSGPIHDATPAELHGVVEVSPSVASKALQELEEVRATMSTWSLGRPHATSAGISSCYLAPDYKVVDAITEKIDRVQDMLREVRDAAPEQYSTLPPSDYEQITGGITGTVRGPILRSVDGTKPVEPAKAPVYPPCSVPGCPCTKTAPPDPLAQVQRMLDDGIAHMEKRGRKLSKELRELCKRGLGTGRCRGRDRETERPCAPPPGLREPQDGVGDPVHSGVSRGVSGSHDDNRSV